MVFSALDANVFTSNAITVQTNSDLQREIDLTERAIRNAANRQKFSVVYDARIIGNPFDDPQDDNHLTSLQISYRDSFINAGYLVTLDAVSGYWKLSWDNQGIEALVSVYSIRTTVVPGAIIDQTIDAINDYFAGLTPVVLSRAEFVEAEPGGDTDESDFGATASSFYEFIAVTRQQDPTADYSNEIRTALTQSGLGYVDSPSNVFVYKVA